MVDGRPETLIEEGCRARREDRLPEAQRHFANAVVLCRKGKDKALLAQALTGMGQIARDLNDCSRALCCYEEAVRIHRGLDQPLRLAHTIRHVGDILRGMGRKVEAAPHYVEALELYRGQDETAPLDLANTLRGYALLKGDNGAFAEAMQLWQEAGRLYAQLDVRAGVAESNAQIARFSAQ
jgi:tetratricopeptide (TPR) repeat protein